jgi:hydroxymethylglutaryl-CoA reductase (NADPH)
MNLKKYKSVKQRREALEKKLNLKLNKIGNFSFAEKEVLNKNCENLIGATHVPLGIAGPISVKSMQNKSLRTYFLPLATTEGALLASVNRGCKAVSLTGAVNVLVDDIGPSRSPVFQVDSLEQGKKLIDWCAKNFRVLKRVAEKEEQFLALKKIESVQVGKNVFLRFIYHTSEAMGMNMVTNATQKAVSFIEKSLKVRCVALSGNYCIDKKPSWLNFIKGRGKKVWAEAVIKKAVVKTVLKTTPEKIIEVNLRKNLVGSGLAGSLGFNAHFANIIAALFLATGQDLAHVADGSLGMTTAELENNNLYICVYLPSLMIGTIGGGTQLACQKQALSILGLDKIKTGDSIRLAEVIGAGVLAGELSLLAALASGHLAKAHQSLGRGKK